jgi:hypothetical protein
MAGITLEQAQAQLDAALTAALDVKANKTVEYNGRKVMKQDLDQINRDIDYWNNQVRMLSAQLRGHGRTATTIPRW